jgi:hypothetical protein
MNLSALNRTSLKKELEPRKRSKLRSEQIPNHDRIPERATENNDCRIKTSTGKNRNIYDINEHDMSTIGAHLTADANHYPEIASSEARPMSDSAVAKTVINPATSFRVLPVFIPVVAHMMGIPIWLEY